jgi:hypothetical protein
MSLNPPCAIRMYDNQLNIINQFLEFMPLMNVIQVCNLPNIDIMKGDYNASLYSNIFLQLNPGNKFAKYLNLISHKEYGTTVGFNVKDILDLKEWIEMSPEENKIVIFDWDGTLSVIEGIIIPPNKVYEDIFEEYGITYKEIAEYYAGSRFRLNILRSLFNYLNYKNVNVFILTNNPIAAIEWNKLNDKKIGPKSRTNFYKVAKEFIPQLKEENILCGYETSCFKPSSVLNNSYLKCMYESIQNWHLINKLDCFLS